MRKASVFTAAIAVPTLLAFSGNRADKISFAPAEGTTITKTFTTTTITDVDEMSMEMNGNPMPIEMEMNMEMVQTVTVTDEYGGVKDGNPTLLTRTFDGIGTELAMDMDMGMAGAQSPSGSGGSELEGSTVVFKWNDETGEYDVSFAEGEDGEAELLDGLTENMDLRGLLPSEELAEGDSYDIEPNALVQVLAAGGDLKLEMEMEGQEGMSMGPDPSTMSDFRQFFEDLVEGEATGKFTGTKDVDGAKIAIIKLNFQVEGAADMADMMSEVMNGEELPEGVEMNLDRVDVSMSYDGEGELHWNLSQGVIHALDLTADVSMDMDMEMGMNMGGQQMDMAMEMSMSGEVKSEVSTE